eukprot:jgi/Orpsp1_1/1183641/evm.model.c7180000086092.1
MPITLNKKKSKNLNIYTNENEENHEVKKKNTNITDYQNSTSSFHSNTIHNTFPEICHHTEINDYHQNNLEKNKEGENENEMIIQTIPNKRKNSNSNSMSISLSIDDIKSEDMASSSNSSSALSIVPSKSRNQHQSSSSSLILQQETNLESKKNKKKNKYNNNKDKNIDNNESSYRDYFYDESEYSCNIEDIQHNNDEIMEKLYDHDNISISSSNISRKNNFENSNSCYDEEFESCECNMSDNDYDISFHSTSNYEEENDGGIDMSNDSDNNNEVEEEEEEEEEVIEEENHCNVKEKNKMDDEKLQKEQQSIRRKIINIQKDTSLNESEKARKIQELMTSSYNSKQKVQNNNITNYQPSEKIDYNRPLTDEEKAITYHNKEKNILGCKHYQRALKIQAHCCGKWFPCRFCHDEVSDHSITSKALTVRMMCMYCSTVQPVNDVCINPNCGKKVARYYCSECKLWDNDPNKNIYHCYDCGICRIGKGLGIDYFHCKTCNVCMSISLKGHHKCIERNLESNCPICGEYMFTSTTTVIFM